jgi:hypothetical protein
MKKLTPEQWKPIPGYRGLYEVSDLGRVRNVRTGRLLKLTPNTAGYLVVDLCRNGVRRQYLVNVLVLLAFVGPRPAPRMMACHDDDVKSNNVLSNLAWKTHAQNVADRIEMDTR